MLPLWIQTPPSGQLRTLVCAGKAVTNASSEREAAWRPRTEGPRGGARWARPRAGAPGRERPSGSGAGSGGLQLAPYLLQTAAQLRPATGGASELILCGSDVNSLREGGASNPKLSAHIPALRDQSSRRERRGRWNSQGALAGSSRGRPAPLPLASPSGGTGKLPAPSFPRADCARAARTRDRRHGAGWR